MRKGERYHRTLIDPNRVRDLLPFLRLSNSYPTVEVFRLLNVPATH